MVAKKSVLVTGGSRGIGRAICVRMAATGLYVLINYKGNIAAAQETLEMVKAAGGDGELLQFDVKEVEQVKAVLGGFIENNPDKPIEVLVNNAGIKDDTLMMWMKDEQWENVRGTSLDGFFYVTREVLNGMLLRKSGRIVNVVSLSGLKGMAGQTNYSAAKAGVIGATKALAQEIARRGITVNAVAPGFIHTDMTGDLNEKDLKQLIPAQRFGKPEEVAHAVAFLASPESGYITGIVLSVNGGLYT
ncbi:3-oxoacyl-ACP reductase FabG [Flavihumibacter petaseus]|uniref:3-oxoacyl-[acyl-carrier-protein] reductase FabG n=1 Tax=Flavihumibacter petaseus NBRC 106054 TaxID=1220578 RepID=A0A0E9MXE9_9BACT|nr:3-oxoacyl-ACP reductase FabG [Flavihumibacter petaseus]GAO42096.1 3-oxoacyl-[acyl-carrier-protein] reductase FabG [Flavihumibacter petaseus NBRC 106054]